MYGKSSLESNWPEPWSFVEGQPLVAGGQWVPGGEGARGQAAALVMDRVGSHGFAVAEVISGYRV